MSPDLNDTDRCEEIAALVDLVECGTNLLRTVNSLLKDIQTLNEISMLLLCAFCFYPFSWQTQTIWKRVVHFHAKN